MVLENHELSFYTDHKVRDNPSSKALSIYCVLQSTINPYTKDKKKSVFQVNRCTCSVMCVQYSCCTDQDLFVFVLVFVGHCLTSSDKLMANGGVDDRGPSEGKQNTYMHIRLLFYCMVHIQCMYMCMYRCDLYY